MRAKTKVHPAISAEFVAIAFRRLVPRKIATSPPVRVLKATAGAKAQIERACAVSWKNHKLSTGDNAKVITAPSTAVQNIKVRIRRA